MPLKNFLFFIALLTIVWYNKEKQRNCFSFLLYFGGSYETKEGFLLNTDAIKFELKNASGNYVSAEPHVFYNEYQKIMALYVLHKIKSPSLECYLRKSEALNSPLLTHEINRIKQEKN